MLSALLPLQSLFLQSLPHPDEPHPVATLLAVERVPLWGGLQAVLESPPLARHAARAPSHLIVARKATRGHLPA